MPRHDLVIIGTGSGNSIPGPEFDDLDIAIVESGRFGGTCLNVGCIPTKSYVYPSDVVAQAGEASRLGVHFEAPQVDWPALRDRVFARLDAIAEGGRAYREGPDDPNVTVYAGHGRFTGAKTLSVSYPDRRPDDEITADRWVIAAGGHAVVPPIDGLTLGPRIHTSDTVMRIDALPESIVILGGGYIAAEFAHVFASLGSRVIQVIRADQILRQQDHDVSAAATRAAAARWQLVTGTRIDRVRADDLGVDVSGVDRAGGPLQARADLVLVALGRVSNARALGVERTGVTLTDDGRVVVDDYQRTVVDGIFALGDVSSPYALKHVANHEMRVVRHNLAHPGSMIATDHRFVPSAVFTHPQIASCGLTEQELEASVRRYVRAHQAYGSTAYGWAREDTEGFVKLLADPATGLLLGAHVVGPEAATVIQPLIQAMSFGQPSHEVATRQYWIHPAMPEVVENALLQLPAPTAAGRR